MDHTLNPAVPSTTGSLLAEECMINPYATLPSFVEMLMIEEASRSARKALANGMKFLQLQLDSYYRRHSQERYRNQMRLQTQAGDRENNFYASIRVASFHLRRYRSELALWVANLLRDYGPEIRCMINYLLERQCLHSEACATVSESLYGTRQSKLSSQPSSFPSFSPATQAQRKLKPLTNKDKTRLALLIALGPYVQNRLLKIYYHSKRNEWHRHHQTSYSYCRRLFLWLYPFLHISQAGINFYYQWRYLLGRSVFFRPSSHLLGLVTRRITQQDEQISSNVTKAMAVPQRTTNANGISSISEAHSLSAISHRGQKSSASSGITFVKRAALWTLTTTVVLSWLAQFRSEYQRQRRAQQQLLREQQSPQYQPSGTSNSLHDTGHDTQSHASIAIPPPPAVAVHSNHSTNALKLSPHLCPICLEPRVYPTASTSGIVFCFKCLLTHVRENETCPVTGMDCPESRIVRLYEPRPVANNTNMPSATTGL